MAKYDLEKFLGDVQSFLAANLATKLTAITTDKGDGLTLKVPDANAYFVQSLNTKEAAYDPYIHIAAVDAHAVPGRGAIGKIYSVNVMLVLADEGTDSKIMARMFRYLRAFEELFTENFAPTRSDVKISVESIVPVPLTEVGSGNFFKATGIQMQVALA